MTIHLLLEEPSAEAFFQELLPKLLPEGTLVKPIVFSGKTDLLKKLSSRLRAYSHWLPVDHRIVVLVDEDRADCVALKKQLEDAARAAGLVTKSTSGDKPFKVLNRVAVEELEAWFFGDVKALVNAFPGVSPHLNKQAKYRNSDGIAGGTWEALERVLQNAGYYKGGLPKIEVARTMGKHMNPASNTSPSFNCFTSGLSAL